MSIASLKDYIASLIGHEFPHTDSDAAETPSEGQDHSKRTRSGHYTALRIASASISAAVSHRAAVREYGPLANQCSEASKMPSWIKTCCDVIVVRVAIYPSNWTTGEYRHKSPNRCFLASGLSSQHLE